MLTALLLTLAASLTTTEAQPNGYRYRTNMVPMVITVQTQQVILEQIPAKRYYYAIRPGPHSMAGIFEFIGEFESDAECFRGIPRDTPEQQQAFVHTTDSIICFTNPVEAHVAWQFQHGFHHRTNVGMGGVAVVQPESPRSPKLPVTMPPMPTPLSTAKSVGGGVGMKSLSIVLPQWSEWPFSYTAVFGQEPRLDSVTSQQTGWQIWFRFQQQSNLCYRICSSNEVGWRPLSSICQQFQDAVNVFQVPVNNFPIDWSMPNDVGQWSALTNLVTTADNISYKLEVQQ
jgi:hypothetical protein